MNKSIIKRKSTPEELEAWLERHNKSLEEVIQYDEYGHRREDVEYEYDEEGHAIKVKGKVKA